MTTANHTNRRDKSHVSQHGQYSTANTGLIATTIVLAAAILACEALPYLEVRTRNVAVLFGVLLFAGVLRNGRALLARSRDPFLIGLILLSVIIIAVAESISPQFEPYQLVGALTTVVLGWVVLLWLLPYFSSHVTPPRVSDDRIPRWWIGVLAVVVLAITAIGHWLAVGSDAKGVEVLYLLQSSWLKFSHFSMPVDPNVADFFKVRHTAYTDGRIFTQFPPGLPIALAAFRVVGLEWWTSPLLSVLTVILAYELGRRVCGSRGGFIAAVLLACNPWFLAGSAGYMPHVVTLPATLGAAILLLDATELDGRAQSLRWLGAGFLIALVFATRPLTGVAVAGTLLLWMLLARPARLTQHALMCAMLGLGAIIPLALTLYYNQQTTGSALTFGYTAVHGHLHALGFGARGFLEYGTDLQRVPKTWPFTPVQGLSHALRYTATVFESWLPVSFTLPAVYLAAAHGFRFRWRYLIPFAILPLVYSLYWYAEGRFISELLPFFLIGAATAFIYVWDRNRQLAVASFALVLFSSLVLSLPWRAAPDVTHMPWRMYLEERQSLHAHEVVQRLEREYGPLLLFVNDTASGVFTPGLTNMYLYNRDGDKGPVLAARDRGELDEKLMASYPGRTPVRVVWPARKTEPSFELMARASR